MASLDSDKLHLDVSLGASFGCNYMTFLFSQPVVLKIIQEVNLELEVEAEVQLIRGKYVLYVYKLLKLLIIHSVHQRFKILH